jgi:hypothetical protein
MVRDVAQPGALLEFVAAKVRSAGGLASRVPGLVLASAALFSGLRVVVLGVARFRAGLKVRSGGGLASRVHDVVVASVAL